MVRMFFLCALVAEISANREAYLMSYDKMRHIFYTKIAYNSNHARTRSGCDYIHTLR